MQQGWASALLVLRCLLEVTDLHVRSGHQCGSVDGFPWGILKLAAIVISVSLVSAPVAAGVCVRMRFKRLRLGKPRPQAARPGTEDWCSRQPRSPTLLPWFGWWPPAELSVAMAVFFVSFVSMGAPSHTSLLSPWQWLIWQKAENFQFNLMNLNLSDPTTSGYCSGQRNRLSLWFHFKEYSPNGNTVPWITVILLIGKPNDQLRMKKALLACRYK